MKRPVSQILKEGYTKEELKDLIKALKEIKKFRPLSSLERSDLIHYEKEYEKETKDTSKAKMAK